MNSSRQAIMLIAALALLLAACGAVAEPAVTEAPATEAAEATATRPPTKTPPLTGPLATAAALNLQITLNPPTPAGGIQVQGPDDYVGLFQQAWNIVNDNYVRGDFNGVDWDAIYDQYLPLFEGVDNQEDHWDLMAQLIRELGDEHSRFVPPTRFQSEFDLQNALPPLQTSQGETGIQFWPGPSREDEYIFVWGVCSNSPAGEEEIEEGAIIQAINGRSVGAPVAGNYIPAQYGPMGSSVTLLIQENENEEVREVTLEYGSVSGCDDWYHELVSTSPRIGYIRVPNFDGNAAHELYSRIQEMEEEAPLDGLVVDVRHNPGGNSDESAGVFAEGVVGTVGKVREGEQRTIYRIRGPVEWNATTPLVVLTDGSSHSAAEYFAVSIKVLERGLTAGMPSAGNTEGIVGFNLADGSIIRLAVTILQLDDGSFIEDVGVQPDIEVPLGQWGLAQDPYDVQLQAAIDFLSGQ